MVELKTWSAWHNKHSLYLAYATKYLSKELGQVLIFSGRVA